MARIDIKEEQFEETRRELAQAGIILYHRKHRKGGFVCRASKNLQKMFNNYETILNHDSHCD